MPWGYAPIEALDVTRERNARFLRQVASVMPVLKDPKLGAISEKQFFADTPNHLTAEAAALRTDELAAQVRETLIWSTVELEHIQP